MQRAAGRCQAQSWPPPVPTAAPDPPPKGLGLVCGASSARPLPAGVLGLALGVPTWLLAGRGVTARCVPPTQAFPPPALRFPSPCLVHTQRGGARWSRDKVQPWAPWAHVGEGGSGLAARPALPPPPPPPPAAALGRDKVPSCLGDTGPSSGAADVAQSPAQICWEQQGLTQAASNTRRCCPQAPRGDAGPWVGHRPHCGTMHNPKPTPESGASSCGSRAGAVPARPVLANPSKPLLQSSPGRTAAGRAQPRAPRGSRPARQELGGDVPRPHPSRDPMDWGCSGGLGGTGEGLLQLGWGGGLTPRHSPHPRMSLGWDFWQKAARKRREGAAESPASSWGRAVREGALPSP